MDGTPHLFDPADPPAGGWTDYVRGVIRVLQRDGLAPAGARVAIASSIPIAAGLSSSAALTVSLAKALTMLARRRVPPANLADIAYRAEHDEVGIRCGRLDQTSVALATPGTALLFECASNQVTQVSMPWRIIVMETGLTRHLATGHYNRRRTECEEALRQLADQGLVSRHLAEFTPADLPRVERMLPAPWLLRARHVITETARTRLAARALATRDLVGFGRLMYEGHASLRDDYQCSCPEADLLVESARRHGAAGARMTGAGWGGAVIVLAAGGSEARVVAETGEDFRREFGRFPEVWQTRAVGGVKGER